MSDAEVASRVEAEAYEEPELIGIEALRGGHQQNELVANFIMSHCPGEIIDGGAGDVAVRLLERLASNVQAALKELGVPDDSYPAPVANAMEFLNTALGKWGQGLD